MKNISKYLIFIVLIFSNKLLAEDLNIFGIGLFDLNKKNNEAIDFRYEKRLDKSLFKLGPEEEALYIVKPFYGIEFTTDSALYGLGGIYIEEQISDKLFITPNIGVGAYSDGNGKELGHTIQFRSTIEISYKIESGNRIGISIGHISNASLGNKNPGSEVLSLSYQTPF